MRAGGNNVYSEDLKERAVKDYLEGKGSLRDITARYGIRDKISLRKLLLHNFNIFPQLLRTAEIY